MRADVRLLHLVVDLGELGIALPVQFRLAAVRLDHQLIIILACSKFYAVLDRNTHRSRLEGLQPRDGPPLDLGDLLAAEGARVVETGGLGMHATPSDVTPDRERDRVALADDDSGAATIYHNFRVRPHV